MSDEIESTESQARGGTLVTCDVPTREFILHLNERHNFLLERLDDATLLIDSAFAELVQQELAKTLERHVFSAAKKDDEA
mmetsp:Transcript_26830/g.83503  ORF Transcript_26830/g.83503 Transcript_26830/m.83503 type:complete len:80 (-) Transcript_26830:70-309(-)